MAAILMGLAVPRSALAELACDAGTLCADGDGDGFAACGCPWSGTPCDCDDADPTTFPGAPERCDSAKDHSCNQVAPDPCPKRKACLEGVCVAECVPLADFGCTSGAKMTYPEAGVCICTPRDCTIFGCPAGLSCDETKTCVPTCGANVRCPPGQICRGGGCVDPCSEVICPEGAVCERGLCRPSCACAPGAACASGQTCDLGASPPRCVEPSCVGVRCEVGSHCRGGACVDDCTDVACPPLRVCRKVAVNAGLPKAKCVDLCDPSPCPSDFICDWRTGACSPPPADGRTVEGPPAREVLELSGNGWLCSAGAVAHGTALGALAGITSLFAFVLRRARRR